MQAKGGGEEKKFFGHVLSFLWHIPVETLKKLIGSESGVQRRGPNRDLNLGVSIKEIIFKTK